MMQILKIDKKWRVMLPRRLRMQAGLPRSGHLEVQARPGTIIMRVVRPRRSTAGTDPVLRDLNNPLKAKKHLSRRDLEKLKDEMWLP